MTSHTRTSGKQPLSLLPALPTPVVRTISLLPWNNIQLKTDANFMESENAAACDENSLNIREEDADAIYDNNGPNRKISYLSFVFSEEVPSIKEHHDDEAEEEQEDIFTASLAPSAFRLRLSPLSETRHHLQQLDPGQLETAFRGLNVRWGH